MKPWGVLLSASYLGLLPILTLLGLSPALQHSPGSGAQVLYPARAVQVTATPTITAETRLEGAVQITATSTITAETQLEGAAQVTPTPTVSATPLPGFSISLAELGYQEEILNSPHETTEFTLRMPEGWRVNQGSFLELDFSYTQTIPDIVDAPPSTSLMGDLTITVDEETQLFFPIQAPVLQHSRLRVALPPDLLNNPDRTSHRIQVTLDASFMCDTPQKARLIIHPTSFFALDYEQVPILADLARYPRPFYQRSFTPDSVRFVLPAAPSPAELSGATAIAARLGNLTGGGLVISGTTDLDLMQELDADAPPREHLIVIGKPDSNALIAELNELGVLPVSLVATDDGYAFTQGDEQVSEGDGIVQEVVSPWDPSRAILVITGLNDEAVYKASQAMSYATDFPGLKGTAALIREVRPLPESSPESVATDLTFGELGYEDRVLWGPTQNIYYYFDIPFGWRLTREAFLDLIFTHSQSIRYAGSSLSVIFNGKPVATLSLNDATYQQGQLRINLPTSLARTGQRNEIRIRSNLQPLAECSDVDMWATISGDSALHLDHNVQSDQALNLDFYPAPFNQRPNLSDVMFILPAAPQLGEWELALKLAATLGDAAGGSKLLPVTTTAEAWSEEDAANYQLIAIGRPSRNAVIQQVNTQLPQPFVPGSDQIEQRLDEVILRLPPDISLGYVQLIASPWNPERALLIVTGTNDQAVAWAIHSLTDQSEVLSGNLAMIRGEQVQTLDTLGLTRAGRASAISTALPELTPVATITSIPTPAALPAAATPVSAPSASGPARPSWLVLLVGVTVLVVAVVIAFAILQAVRHRRTTEY